MKKSTLALILAGTILASSSFTVYAKEDDALDEQVETVKSEEPATEPSLAGLDGESENNCEVEEKLEEEVDKEPEENIKAETEDMAEEELGEIDNPADEELELVPYTNTVYTCNININYSIKSHLVENLEISDEIVENSLSTSFSIEKGQEISSDFINSFDENLREVLKACQLPSSCDTGFDISASIDCNGKVKINSLTPTEPAEEQITIYKYQPKEKLD